MMHHEPLQTTENNALFSVDYHGFYQNGNPFFPLIQDINADSIEWANTVVLRLPAQLRDDLDWTEQIEAARLYIDSSKLILWEIDLGLDAYQFDPQDSAAFLSFTLALDEFTEKIWPIFRNHTFGIILYRGGFDPSAAFPVSKWEIAYSEWLENKRALVPTWIELKPSSDDEYSLFCVQNFAEYLHRLVSFLPDIALAFAMVDVSSFKSAAKIAQFFSKERFEHTQLILKGAHFPFCGITWEAGNLAHGWIGHSHRKMNATEPSSLGIYLPKDNRIDHGILKELDVIIASYIEANTPFRIVLEEKLTEQWDGLDRIVVLSKTVSPQGKRKLLGFIAAGGTVATIGELLGLPEEESISLISS